MWKIARRPRWIAALVFALAVAAAFAALGQWQLARSFDNVAVPEVETEIAVPIEELTDPGVPVTTEAAGQMVETDGTLIAGDFVVLSGRVNGGEAGYWVTGHVVTDAGPSVAVGLGWTETAEQADAAIQQLGDEDTSVSILGRYLPTEAPQEGEFETERAAMSVGALLNLWADPPGPVYSGYIVSNEAPAGLDRIDSLAPSGEVSLNWLNIFYAAEWVIFAGFAVFLWWRLVKDEWEREQEESGALDAPVE